MMSDSRVISGGLTSSTDSIIDSCQTSISEHYLIPAGVSLIASLIPNHEASTVRPVLCSGLNLDNFL